MSLILAYWEKGRKTDKDSSGRQNSPTDLPLGQNGDNYLLLVKQLELWFWA